MSTKLSAVVYLSPCYCNSCHRPRSGVMEDAASMDVVMSNLYVVQIVRDVSPRTKQLRSL